MSENLELYGLEKITLQSNSSKSLLGTINTGFDKCDEIKHELPIKPKKINKQTIKLCNDKCSGNITVTENLIPKYKLNSVVNTNENSIIGKVDTGFGDGKLINTECKKPEYKTHLCKESYFSEFKSESEKNLARTNLDVYSKEETRLILIQNVSEFVTKDELEESVKDLDYTTSRSKSVANYTIPDNLFK